MSHTITTSSISNVQWGDLSQDGYYCSLSFDWELDVDDSPVSLFIDLVDGNGDSISGDLYTPEEVEFTGEDTYQISLNTITVDKNYSGIVHLSVVDGDDEPVAFDAGTSDELGTLPTPQTFNVVVTARDIEFSNYNSTTGKWGNAVMTMMIMDSLTEELEGYNEKVYAVFKNHEDPTDLIEFSAEVDGLDTRVTTSDPMVPSAKYELYKIYGNTSGNEYLTSSQFYFQVPGKLWDFTNDTVDHDVSLVSDWFNYGYVKDTNDVIHGITSTNELFDAVTLSNDTTAASVNGASLTRGDIKELKITSMLGSNLTYTSASLPSGHNGQYFLNRYNNLEHIDIVSARITKFTENTASPSSYLDIYGISGNKFNDRFAFPETLQCATLCSNDASTVFNQPVYFPDSVTRISEAMRDMGTRNTYDKKIRFSPNLRYMSYYNFNLTYNKPLYPLSNNVQLSLNQHPHVFALQNFNQKFDIPSVWTNIPNYFFYHFTRYDHDIDIPEGITGIGTNAYSYLGLGMDGVTKTVTFPSSLVTIDGGAFSDFQVSTNANFDLSKCNSLTSLGSNFSGNGLRVHDFKWPTVRPVKFRSIPAYLFRWAYNLLPVDENNVVNFEFPEGITTINNNCLTFNSNGMFIDRTDVDEDTVFKVVFPSTLTTIGSNFGSELITGWRRIGKKVTLDFTKLNPDDVTIDDQWNEERGMGTFMFASQHSGDIRNEYELKILVAPGTQEAWEAKLPNFYIVNPSWVSGNATYYRNIEWVETPTPQYGYVFYKENWSDTEEKYVELQSVAEFESLAFSSYDQTATVGEDQIVLNTGARGNYDTTTSIDQTKTNIITGVRIGTNITSIPANFLRYCKGISNKNVIIPDNVTSLGARFMHYCTNFSGKVRFPSNITSIPDFTLSQVNNFNYPIVVPEGVTSIGNGFLANAYIFNSSVTLPSTLTSIGNEFLFDGSGDANGFNQPISIPSSVTSIGDNFLHGRRNFNQPITLPSGLTSLGGQFMSGCSSFNQPLTIPAGVTQLSAFLNYCSSFNSEITILGTLTQISGYFMQNMTSFDRDLNLPCGTNCRFYSDIAFVDMKSMTHTINFNDLQASNIIRPSQRPAFATQDSTAACYTTGIKISGIDSAAIVAMFPDLDGTGTGIDSGYYRHLIRTGTSQPTNPGGK